MRGDEPEKVFQSIVQIVTVWLFAVILFILGDVHPMSEVCWVAAGMTVLPFLRLVRYF